jgi:site-specific recombinase XerD
MDTTAISQQVDGAVWSDAIQRWLQALRSESTRRAYAKALEDLLSTSSRLPWEITVEDVLAWKNAMESRRYKPATIRLRVSAVTAFYQSAGKPIEGLAVETSQPAIDPAARVLTPEETKQLLRRIYRENVGALRDYALFLGLILIDDKALDWRTARWGDCVRDDRADLQTGIPLPVFNAACTYLRAAGRLNTISSNESIFTALRRKGKTSPRGTTIQPDQPISAHEVGRLLRRYLQIAGITKDVKPHHLPRAGAAIRDQVGESYLAIMEYLGAGHLATSRIFIHGLDAQLEAHWLSVNELIDLEDK